MYEYIITAFKVMVGVITNNRIAIAGLIALGILLIWEFFSLIFSFQGRFASNVKRLNNYISRNGIVGDAREGLTELLSKMPTEFQRGYKRFERNPNTLPSENIKRFESLEMEISGGVFNQNKSVIKTFINFIFVSLLVFSLAILSPEDALTGYMVAEAAIIPLIFLILAKVLYYVYTAIRQYQYKVAIEEFNLMLENLDKTAKDTFTETTYQQQETANHVRNIVNQEKYVPEIIDEIIEEEVKEPLYDNAPYVAPNYQEEAVEVDNNEALVLEEDVSEDLLTDEVVENQDEVEETNKEYDFEEEEDLPIQEENQDALDVNTSEEPQVLVEEKKEEKNYQDNFKPDFSSLLDGEEVETVVKRGRGRPRKEVSDSGEFVIKNDKEFEEALVRAEKLMRKNEEPLSASQTKRIEKQIKELVDAMTKYKEGK